MKKNLRFIIIGVILVVLIIGYYYYISNYRKPKDTHKNESKMTVVGELISRDLAKDYPPTPKEVVKMYSDITVAFYKEEYTQDEFKAMAAKMYELFDPEFAAKTPIDVFMNNLNSEIAGFKSQGMGVTSYATSSSTDVFYFESDGRNWARLNATYTLRKEKEIGVSTEVFVLRRDENRHWKIYGWALAEEEEDNE